MQHKMEIKLEKGAVQICRICLQNIEPDSPILYLNCADSQNSSVTIEDKLIECVPELNLYTVPNAIICNECSIALSSAYSLKLKCRQTEMQIKKYLQQINGTTLFDLAEVQHMDVHNGSIKVDEQVIPYLKMEMDDGSVSGSSVVEDNFTVNTEEVLRDERCTNLDNTDTYYSCYVCEYTTETDSELSLHMQTHADIEESATSTIPSMLPQKSRSKYEKVYDRFLIWCDEQKVTSTNVKEKDLLTYFEHLSKNYKPSSLWAFYSMLRTMISMKENKDISKYSQLITFVKRQNKGYRPKKAKVLSMADIGKFLKEADDQSFLLVKVATIIGIAGACRMEELTNLLLENVKNEGQVLQIQIPNTKTKIPRQFFVTSGGIEGLNMVEIVRKYLKLRPLHADHRRFFVGYRKGSCTKQPVGINTFHSMPKKIASFLSLTNPSEYTGNCFRRLSTSLVSVSGGDFLTVKHDRGWKSSTVAEVYIDTSNENKKKVAKKFRDYPT